jgi:hypothetical protein
MRLFRNEPQSLRRVVSVLAQKGGQFDRVGEVAEQAGFRDRDQLHQLLAERDLPPLTALARLVRVLNWTLETEDKSLTLATLAREDGRYLAHYSRDVRKALGVSWSELRELGSDWLVEQIADRVA